MDHLPKDVAFAAARMSNYNRNRFRLETVSSETASPGRIVTVNLPENALLDMRSFKFHFDVTCNSVTVGGATVRGRLPPDASSLISRVEVFINGIQVQQGTAEYGSIARILKIGRSSRDKDGSIDRALQHSAVIPDDAAEDVSVVLSSWCGFLGETATRYLPTDLLGQIQVRLTFASPSVLVPKEQGVDVGDNLSGGDARTAATNLTYAVSNMYFTVDSILMDGVYSKLLNDRLSTE